jgi:hypothetical protein
MHFDVKKSAASGKGAALSGSLDLQPSCHLRTLPPRVFARVCLVCHRPAVNGYQVFGHSVFDDSAQSALSQSALT